MAIPTYDQFIEPVLRFLAAHPEGLPVRTVHEAVADALGITEAERQQLLASGTQPVYKNRAGWAHDRLKRAGLSDSPRRGFWKITEKGLDFIKNHPHSLEGVEVERLATEFLDVRLRKLPGAIDRLPEDQEVEPKSTQTPEDRLDHALMEIRNTVAIELLDTVLHVSPSFFEAIVLDLLHKMGYGTNRADLQRVGGSGDGGIDGVISRDKLGLEKVYIQAKRWQNSVGRPEVQAFYGALAGQRANKGVFITTSTYTAQAVDFARSVEKIVLVDGARLVELMLDYEIGISSKTVRIPKIDSDYFDEGTA